MAAMKQAQGPTYLQPQPPLGMGSILVKLASNCALHWIRGAMGPAVGPAQFSVETKGGYDLVQWALQMALESNGKLSAACLDGVNAFGEINRSCIRAAIEANPSLHLPLPFLRCFTKGAVGRFSITTSMATTSPTTTARTEFARVLSLVPFCFASSCNLST